MIEPSRIVFAETHIGSNKPPRALPPIYPTWWRGREWWNALPIAKLESWSPRNKRHRVKVKHDGTIRH